MDEFIGIVKLFAGTFAPRGWALCDGSLLNISQNSALFSILGTTYGGNGTQTFALPDLRGRVAVGAGNSQPPVQPGQMSGSANVTLTTQQLPQHTHAQQFANVPATTNSPAGNVLAQVLASDGDGIALTTNAYAPSASLVAGSPTAIGNTGNNQPLSVMQPYLGMNYIICLEGVFPSRN